MKQKRTFVTLLLIVGLLCLGIAYAAFTADELQITGTATASVAEGNVDVEFVAVTPEKADGVTTYGEITEDPDEATFTVADLTTAGNSKSVVFTIENKTENGVPVTLETPTITWANGTSSNEWYEVSYEYGKTDLDAADENAATGEDTTTLTVTVTLLKTISTSASASEANTENTVTITLNATAADN